MRKDEPQEYEIKDKPLSCAICGGNKFWKEETRIEKFFSFDRDAVTYTCDECGHIMWFVD